MATKLFTVGAEVVYCDEHQVDQRAFVTDVGEDGAVRGLSVHDIAGAIVCGVSDPKLATTPAERIMPGYFRAR